MTDFRGGGSGGGVGGAGALSFFVGGAAFTLRAKQPPAPKPKVAAPAANVAAWKSAAATFVPLVTPTHFVPPPSAPVTFPLITKPKLQPTPKLKKPKAKAPTEPVAFADAGADAAGDAADVHAKAEAVVVVKPKPKAKVKVKSAAKSGDTKTPAKANGEKKKKLTTKQADDDAAEEAAAASATPIVLNVKPSHVKGKIESSRAVSVVVAELGWRELVDLSAGKYTRQPWTIGWVDALDASFYRAVIQPHHRVNHFPAIEQLCRKKNLARHLNAMRRAAPDHYGFFPFTWLLPQDDHALADAMAANANPTDADAGDADGGGEGSGRRKHTFIIKPDGQCQGKGIFLARDSDDLHADPTAATAMRDAVAQLYVPNPYLIRGRKFDLRVYVLVTSVTPLRVYLFDGGLTRFCTEPYAAPSDTNLQSVCTHLTNYALNKELNPHKFVLNTDAERDDVGSKWTLHAAFRHIRDAVATATTGAGGSAAGLAAGGEAVNRLWAGVADVIVRTIVSAQPALESAYNSQFPRDRDGARCFQLLGFDILLDRALHPWLIEINRSPSLAMDTPLDAKIKLALCKQILQIVDPTAYAPTDAQLKRDAKAGSKLTGLAYKQWAEEQRAEGLRARLAHERLTTRARDGAPCAAPDFQLIYPSIRAVTHPVGRDAIAAAAAAPAATPTGSAAAAAGAAKPPSAPAPASAAGGEDEGSDSDGDSDADGGGDEAEAAASPTTGAALDAKSTPTAAEPSAVPSAAAEDTKSAPASARSASDSLAALNTHMYSTAAGAPTLKPKALKAVYKRLRAVSKRVFSQTKSLPADIISPAAARAAKRAVVMRETQKAAAHKLSARIAAKQQSTDSKSKA